MVDTIPGRSLIDIIYRNSDRAISLPSAKYTTQFSLFLGAGASHSSGVMLASEMVDRFRQMYAERYPSQDLNDERWYRTDAPYSTLFEKLFPTPSLRRDYIERVLEYASPSMGYLYLVNLLEEKFFNTVFTTNFDDVLNESCYLFSANVRPIVCAHDSSVRSIRMNSPRPKILKLHGDFLFDNIRNTAHELESLETNMRDKFSQYAREFGLIVIGYSGSDRSVMDIMDHLLETKDAFPHGVFWCVRPQQTLDGRVERLARFARFHVVEIHSFDTFMAELHSKLSIGQHPVIQSPYHALGSRMLRILNTLPTASEDGQMHPILKRDLIELGNAVRDERKLEAVARPINCMAFAAEEKGNIDEAAGYVLEQLAESTASIGALYDAFKIGLRLLGKRAKTGFANELFDALVKSKVVERYPFHFNVNQATVDLILNNELSVAISALDLALKHRSFEDDHSAINRAQILLRRNVEFPLELRRRLKKMVTSDACLTRFGAKIVLGKGKQAVDDIEASMDKNSNVDSVSIDYVRSWPICGLLSMKQRTRLAAL